jgi:hypothetical protein
LLTIITVIFLPPHQQTKPLLLSELHCYNIHLLPVPN